MDEVPATEDMDLYGEEEEDDGNDVRRMGRIWVKERGTVDIMQWEGDLIDTLFDKLEQQVSSMLHHEEAEHWKGVRRVGADWGGFRPKWSIRFERIQKPRKRSTSS